MGPKSLTALPMAPLRIPATTPANAHANNALETDHGRPKARLRPMRGLKRDRMAGVIVAAHAFVQNLRRGFYDLGTDASPPLRLTDAFAELALVI
jgi:transposase, IS6 family